MNIVEKSIIFIFFLVITITTFWLQMDSEESIENINIQLHENIDYYIKNFTTTHVNEGGTVAHILEGAKLVHYEDDDTAFITSPHVIEYLDNDIIQHTYSETGWLASGGSQIQLNNNVKVFQHKKIDPNDNTDSNIEITEILSTNQLLIKLDNTEN